MEGNESKRYYPSEQELDILTGGIAQYFNYAERSPERSSFATEISAKLQKFSGHWTKRAVRLWFNNNKAIFFLNDKSNNTPKDPIPPPAVPIQQPIMQPAVHFIQPVQPKPIIPPAPIPQNPVPIQMPQNQIQMPPSQPSVSLPAMPKKSTWLDKPAPQLVTNTEFLTKLENSLSHVSDSLSEMLQASNNFDTICQQMHQNYISNSFDNVRMFKSVKFPKKPDASFHETASAVWQPRAHQVTTIRNFDTSFIGPDITMYIHSDTVTPDRVISYTNNGEKWQMLKLGIRSHLENLVGNKRYAFAMSCDSIIIADFERNEVSKEITLMPSSSGLTSLAMASGSSAICGFAVSPSLFLVKNDGTFESFETNSDPKWGISAIHVLSCDLSKGIVTSFSQSPSLRLFSVDRKVIRYFIGHTEPIVFIKSYNDIMMTASEDKSCKLWDIRAPTPTLSLLTNFKSINGICLSEHYALVSTADQSICAYDIRNSSAALGVISDEYNALSPFYDENSDELQVFGIASKDGIADSTLFINDDMQSSKYAIVKYNPFLGD